MFVKQVEPENAFILVNVRASVGRPALEVSSDPGGGKLRLIDRDPAQLTRPAVGYRGRVCQGRVDP